VKQKTTLFKARCSAPFSELPDLGTWLQERYLEAPPALWSTLAKLTKPRGERVLSIHVVTITDDEIALVEVIETGPDSARTELVSNQPF
jgi:hypothetical protein